MCGVQKKSSSLFCRSIVERNERSIRRATFVLNFEQIYFEHSHAKYQAVMSEEQTHLANGSTLIIIKTKGDQNE
jgi:hypothetical protein